MFSSLAPRSGQGKRGHGDPKRQTQGRVDALVAQRGKARLQHADGRGSEALQPSDVVCQHGVDLAARDDRADEGGGPHAVHAQQPGAIEARRFFNKSECLLI